MSDNLIPFRRRSEQPAAQPDSEAQAMPALKAIKTTKAVDKAAEPTAAVDAGLGGEHAEWTMVQIVAKAPPTSR